MPRKAIVNYSLIRDLTNNLKVNDLKFIGKIETSHDERTLKKITKDKSVKRFLLSATTKKNKKREPSSSRDKSSGAKRFRQFEPASEHSESESSSASSFADDSAEFDGDEWSPDRTKISSR